MPLPGVSHEPRQRHVRVLRRRGGHPSGRRDSALPGLPCHLRNLPLPAIDASLAPVRRLPFRSRKNRTRKHRPVRSLQGERTGLLCSGERGLGTMNVHAPGALLRPLRDPVPTVPAGCGSDLRVQRASCLPAGQSLWADPIHPGELRGPEKRSWTPCRGIRTFYALVRNLPRIVLLRRHGFQVVQPDAPTVPAEVVYLPPIWDQAAGQHIYHPMRWRAAAPSVPFRAYTPNPVPTSRYRVDLHHFGYVQIHRHVSNFSTKCPFSPNLSGHVGRRNPTSLISNIG